MKYFHLISYCCISTFINTVLTYPGVYNTNPYVSLHSVFRLGSVLLLVDGTVGITETDIIGLNMLEEITVSYAVSEKCHCDRSGPQILVCLQSLCTTVTLL